VTRQSLTVRVLERDGFTCVYCGLAAGTKDHIIPLVAGGHPSSMENLVACCARCNGRKGSRTPAQWLRSFGAEGRKGKAGPPALLERFVEKGPAGLMRGRVEGPPAYGHYWETDGV